MEEIDFESDDYADILAKDARFDARAYAFLGDVVRWLTNESSQRHTTAEDILAEFKSLAYDQYGPLAYTVLHEWGVTCTEDIGEMMRNLVDTHRIQRSPSDSYDDFNGGFDFKEAFLDPFLP